MQTASSIRIRHKVLLIVLASAVLVLCTISVLSHYFIATNFKDQEVHTSSAAFQQSKDWLNHAANSRRMLAADWGCWDDIYNQIAQPSLKFREASLTAKDLSNLDNSLYLAIDTNGTIIDQVCIGPNNSQLPCPKSWSEPFKRQVPQWNQSGIKTPSGIVSLGHHTFAVGISEVTPHTYVARRNGYVVMGKAIFTEKIPIPGGLGSVQIDPSSHSANGPIEIQTITADSMEISSNLAGIPNITGAKVSATIPRILYQESKNSLSNLILWMLVLGGLITFALLKFLRVSIVQRIETLCHDLERVGQEGQGSRVRVLGNDDIGDLCTQVNRTLEQLDNTRAEFEARRLFDADTGIPNRNHFLSVLTDRMERESDDRGMGFAMILISLNRFQRVSDTCGHDASREVLAEVAERLRLLPKLGYLARVANAEFALLVEQTDEISVLTRLSDAIRHTLEDPFVISTTKQEICIHVCIGISMAHDMMRITSQEALRRAEAALHNLEKEDATSSVALFDPELDRRARDQMDLEKDLRRALEQGEFAVAFQPIFELASGHVVGFESLLRWKHPIKGMVPPLHFIPLAEETGLIEQIGEWVLRDSCRQLMEWSERYPVIANTFLSVNLSVRQFRDPKLISKIWHAVQNCGFPFERLKLEITESAMMDNPQECSHRLKSLTDLGIRLSLDDFGTGFSSLGYLDRFPVSTIKLDKTFIDKLLVNPNSPIVRSVATVAQVMGYDLIAEGVEKQSQADALSRMGCGYVQGYLFAKPMLASDAENWLRDLPRPLERSIHQ